MKLKLRYYGDPLLREKAEPVETIDDEIKEIAKNLIDSMYAENGLGLAAPQVGILKRMFAMDAGEKRGHPIVLINPHLSDPQGSLIMEEGCLSFPGIYVKVKRAEKVTISGTLVNGSTYQTTLEGIECRAVLHEMDHLDGVLLYDRMTPSQRIVYKGKLKKIMKLSKEEDSIH